MEQDMGLHIFKNQLTHNTCRSTEGVNLNSAPAPKKTQRGLGKRSTCSTSTRARKASSTTRDTKGQRQHC